MSGAVAAAAYAPSAVLRLDDGDYENIATDPGDAQLILSLSSDGTLSISGAGISYAYLIGDSPALYEARATTITGTPSTGTAGSWLPLSAGQSWSVERTTLGSKVWSFTLALSLLGTSTPIESATISLTAAVESGA